MYLYIDFDKCRGCRTCEMTCSFRWKKSFSPSQSAIIVMKNEPEGKNFPIVCQQCTKPLCMEVCLSGAISKDSKTAVVLHNPEKCIGCKMCVISCPFGGIGYIAELGVARKCDLCQSYNPESKKGTLSPQCEEMCPYGAIKLVKEEKLSNEIKIKLIEKFGVYSNLIK